MPDGFFLGRAYSEIVLDASGIAEGMAQAKKTISSGFKDIGDSMKSFGGSLTAIGAPFAVLGGLALKAASDSADAVGQLDAVLKSTAGAAGVTRDMALDLASGLQKVTKFSDETVLSTESMLLTFGNIGKNIFPQVTKMALDMSQALGQDTKTSAIQLGKAMQDPIKGAASLKKVGVALTEAQEELIKKLVESGDVMGAQQVILKELSAEFGGSAEAAGKTFSGRLEIMRNRVDDLMEGIGNSLMPVIEELLGWIGKAVDWFTALDDSTKGLIAGAIAVGASLAVIGPIIAGVGAAITAVGGILAVVFSPIGLIIAGVVGAILLLKTAFETNFLGIRDFLQPIIDSIGDFFLHFSDRVKLYGSLIALYFAYYVTNPLGDFWNQKLKPAFDAFSSWFTSEGLPLIQGAMQSFKDDIWDPIVGVFGGIWEAVKTGLGLFADWWSAPGGGLAGVQTAIQTIREKWIDPFILTLQNAWTNIKPGVEAIANWFRDQFQHIGEWYIDPVLKFIARITTDVDAAIKKLQELLGIKDEADKKSQTPSGSYSLPSNMIQPNVQPAPFGIGDAVNLAMAGFLGSIGGLPGAGLNNLNANLATVPIPPVYGGSSRPRAYGGDVQAGMRYLVGERGSETFTPQTNGTITPNGGDAGSGLVINGDIHITASTEAGGRAAAKGFKEELEATFRGRGNS